MSRDPVTTTPASADQPAIRGFQLDQRGVGRIARSVNCFRGDVNLPWQLVGLEGLNGLSIALTAFYASNLGDSAVLSNEYTPTSILGLGWSLPLTRVVVQRKTTASDLDGIYHFEYEGQLHQLIWVGAQGGVLRFAVKQEPLWIVEYEPESETWTLWHENGDRSILGGAPERGTLEYGLLWENWVGASTSTEPPPKPYVVAWNLAATQTVWGNSLRFSYLADNVEVTAGAFYTRGNYLSQVEDSLGQAIKLHYEDKKPFEYVPPHQFPDGSPNPAYQDRYGTRALAAIDVYTHLAGGEVVRQVKFDYDFRDLKGDNSERFKKRLLVAIHDLRDGVVRAPAVRFDYNPVNTLHPGGFREVIFPDGARSTYTYQRLPLNAGAANNRFQKNIAVDNPLLGSSPRVWHGPDYLIVLWHSETQARTLVQVFSHGGIWSDPWQVEVPGNVNLDDVRAALGAESFALYIAPKTPSGNQQLHLFRRKQYQFGNWDHVTERVDVSGSIQATETNLAMGSDFVVFNVGGTTTVHRFTYDRVTESWRVESTNATATSNVVVAAFGYYYIAGYYQANSRDLRYQLFYRDRAGNWQNRPIGPASTNVQWRPDYAGSLWAVAGNFAVATFCEQGTNRPKLRFLWWDESFEVLGDLTKDGDASFSAVYGATVASGRYVYRFNAGSWNALDFGPDPGGSALYAYGEDFALRVRTAASPPVSVAVYDPNAGDWQYEQSPVNSAALFAPTFSERIATIGPSILRRRPSGDWTEVGELPSGANPESFVNHAPGYLVFQDRPGDARKTKTSVLLLRDGSILRTHEYPEQMILPDQAAVSKYSFTGPAALVTYPAGESISSPSQLYLHRILNDALDDEQTDDVVHKVSIDDGYETFITRYDYDAKQAVFDASGLVVQYPVVTQFFEDKDGRNVGGSTETHYYNGLDNPELKNLRDYYSLLSGWEHSSIDRTADGLPIFRQESALTAVEVKSGIASPVGVRIPLTIVRLARRDQTDALVQIFQIAASAAGSFNRGQIPADVRARFQHTGFPLADGATVQVVKTDRAWIIASDDTQYGARVGLLGEIEITGEVTQRRFCEYDTATGLVRSQSLVYHDWQGNEETLQTVSTYAWEVPMYAGMIDRRQLSEIAVTTTTNTASGHTVASTATTYAHDWSGTKVQAWAPQGSYHWNGTSARAPAFDFSHPQANDNWIRREQIHARIGYGLPQTTSAADAGLSSVLYDAERLRSVAVFRNVDLAAPGPPQATYLGFERYEDLQAWKRDDSKPINDLITSEDAHTGRRSLKLPGGASGPAIESRFHMPAAVGRGALSCWVRTPPGFSAQAQAGWQITPSGSPPHFAAFPDTGGRWQCVQVFFELPSAGGEVTCRAVNRVEHQPVLIDDVSVVPLPGAMQATVFDERTWLTIATLDANGATSRTIHDRFLNPIAQLAPGDQVTSLSARFFSRMAARNDRFDPAVPNAAIEVACSDGGFLQSLRDTSWTERWSPSPVDAWAVQQGALTYVGSGSATLTLKNAVTESNYGLRTRFMPGADGVDAKLGIAVGDAAKVVWDPAVHEWQLLNADGTVLARSPCAEVKQSDWLLIAAAHGLSFYCDGQLMLQAWLPDGFRGALQLFTEGNPGIAYAEIMVFYRPRLCVTFTDASGSVRQSQQLDRTGTVVQGQLKDRMAQVSIQTKAMRYEQAMPAYQGHFVTGLDWSSGVLQGQLAAYYSGGERSNDEGYPYSRQLFEAAPAPRKIAEGRPGKVLAIRPGNTHISTITLGANTKATMFAALPLGRYYAQMVRDPDGNVTTTFRDLARHVLGKSLRASTSMPEQRSSVGLNVRGQVDKVFPPNYHVPPAGSTANDYIVTRAVDVLGRLLESVSSDTHQTRCVYDDAGRLRFILPADGISAGSNGNDRLSYTKYDALGRACETGTVDIVWDRAQLTLLAKQDWPDADASWETRSTYDGPIANGVGRLFTLARAGAGGMSAWQQQRRYDVRGNVVRAEQLAAGDSAAFEILYSLNMIGETVALAYPKPVGHDPDLVVTYGYNPLGLVDAIGTPAEPQRWAALAYGADGQIISETLNPHGGKSVRQTFRYNSPGLPIAIASDGFTETLSYWEEAGADGRTYYNGQVAGIRYSFGQTEQAAGLRDYRWRFAYNPQGEVQVAENPTFPEYSLGSPSQPVVYDANGNITRLPRGGQADEFTYYAGTNKLKNTDGSTTAAFTYTESGRTQRTPQSAATLQYDQVDGLTLKATDASGAQTIIEYGEGDRRAKLFAPDDVERKYYFGVEGRPLAEEYKAGNARDTVRFIAGAGRLLAVVNGNTTGYVVADHEMSSRMVLDDQGQVLGGYNYLPFGGAMGNFVGSKPQFVRYLYTGQEWDGHTGFYNMNARWYDPRTRRFLVTDPLQQFPSPYLYAANDPILFIDPAGEGVWDFIGSLIVSIGITVGGLMMFNPIAIATGVNGIVYAGRRGTNANFGEFASIQGSAILSAGMIAGGVAVDIISGGSAAAIGATLIGGGIGGFGTSYTAAITAGEHFDQGDYWKSFGIGVGVGLTTGAITGGFGALGSGAAAAVNATSNVAKFGAAVGFGALGGAAGGAASGAVAQTIRNKVAGRTLGEGVGEAALFQGLVGGILAGPGNALASKLAGAGAGGGAQPPTVGAKFLKSFAFGTAAGENVARTTAPLIFNTGGLIFTKSGMPQQWW